MTGTVTLASPAVSNTLPGKVYVLAVGVNDYEFLSQLKGSVNNAKLIGDVFKKSAIMGEVRVLLDKDATKSNILDVLEQYYNRLNANDQLVLYYSGHGGPNAMNWQTRAVNSGKYTFRNENIYDETIMPYDATYDKKSQLTSAELGEKFKKFKTNQITIIIDSAYELNNSRQSFASFQGTNTIRRPRFSMRDLNMYGYNVLTGADWDEAAWIGIFNGEIQGIFTHFLVQGIKSKAANVRMTNSLSINDIYEYARSNAVQYIGIQHPQFNRGRNPDVIVWKDEEVYDCAQPRRQNSCQIVN